MGDITKENHPENQPEKEREPVIDLGYRTREIGAFPCSPFSVPGMSLRDYMATASLYALLPPTTADWESTADPEGEIPALLPKVEVAARNVARVAYMVADAMLEARKR